MSPIRLETVFKGSLDWRARCRQVSGKTIILRRVANETFLHCSLSVTYDTFYLYTAAFFFVYRQLCVWITVEDEILGSLAAAGTGVGNDFAVQTRSGNTHDIRLAYPVASYQDALRQAKATFVQTNPSLRM